MMGPLVSAIIAVKNGERFLASAIDSVLQQNYKPIELIVVDGQSVDRTAEIARSYGVVRYIRQTNRGVGDAWNVGIDAADGEFFAFLSHDDLWMPNKLALQIGYMTRHPEIQYTVTRVKFFLEPGVHVPSRFKEELLEGDHVGRMMETLVARRSVFGLVGRFNPEYTTAEDVDWYAKAKDMDVPMGVIPQVLVQKRMHDANTTYSSRDFHDNLLNVLRDSVRRQRCRTP